MACATLKRSLDFDPLQSPRPTKRRRYLAPCTPTSIPPTKTIISPFTGEEFSRVSQESITSNLREEMRRLHRRKQLHFGVEPGSSAQEEREGSPNRDKPLFTFRQVGIICERLLREREDQLRETYEEALNTKLSEQYDTFVKFTQDQLKRRFESTSAPSYLS